MIKAIDNKCIALFAIFMTGLLTHSSEASANDFSDIARNINRSIEELPGLVSGIAYMLGLLLGVMGILKLKDHVENPTQTPMKDGAIRLASGGALFGLPIVFEAMTETIGTTGAQVSPATLNRIDFNVN